MSAATDNVPSDDPWMKWYDPNPPNIKPETKEVLEKYSKIPSDEIIPHVQQIRDKAWAIRNYPCIGQWRFLDLWIGRQAIYPEILERMRSGEQIFLDLGCAFAQDIRRLVADGVDSSKCYGSDLRLEFMDLGYELFRDKGTLKTKFIEGDIFDEDSPLKELNGKINIVGASAFFHLFNWDQQKIVAHRVAKLIKPQKGSLVVGVQVGHTTPGETPASRDSGSRYQHNLESWRKMWDEVGDETGVKYKVEGKETSLATKFKQIGDIMLEYSVRRV